MSAVVGRVDDALRAAFGPSLTARHGPPLLLLAVLVCAFYAPQLISGTVQWDGVDVHYSSQRYFSEAVRAGNLPFWTPYIFSGFPFLADLQVGAWYPLNWPFFLAGIGPTSISGELLLHGLIACGGAYALAVRLIGDNPPAAVGSAILYGLSGYFAAHAQHVGMVQTAAWLPWLVLLLDVLGDGLSPTLLALAVVQGAALVLPGHFQVALYAVCGAGLWALLDALARRAAHVARRRAVGLVAVAVGGALLSAVMILPAMELVGESVRAELDAAGVDIGYFHVGSLFTLVRPDYYGLLSGSYHGPGDSTQHYFYASVLLVPLVLVGLRHASVRRAALLLGLPFVWYAMGPAGGLFRVVSVLPGFRSVELPMHGWFLPALGLALLGGAGLGAIHTQLRRPWLATLLLLVMFGDVFVFNELQNPLAYARQSFDTLYGAPLRLLDTQLQAAQPPMERLYGTPMAAVGYRDHPLQSHVEATYGYNPLELADYAAYAHAAESNPRLVDGLAATHRLSVSTDGRVTIQSNPSALPLALFARHLVGVPDAASARASLNMLDPAEVTIIVGSLPVGPPDPSASASVLAHESAGDRLTIHYRSASPGVLRVAMPYYPGWHATQNGVDLRVLKVDAALLGIVVPAGEDTLQLWYAPTYFWPGALLSALTLIIVMLVVKSPKR
ncbi:MAG: YfhO family protein [Chloroflexota bacterium]|nr:YfhO family protein [Chloroflexota bacterium]